MARMRWFAEDKSSGRPLGTHKTGARHIPPPRTEEEQRDYDQEREQAGLFSAKADSGKYDRIATQFLKDCGEKVGKGKRRGMLINYKMGEE